MENEKIILERLKDISEQMETMIINQSNLAGIIEESRQEAPPKQQPQNSISIFDLRDVCQEIKNYIYDKCTRSTTSIYAHLSDMDSQLLNAVWRDVKKYEIAVGRLILCRFIAAIIILIVLFSAQAIYYYRSPVYWGNRAYKAAVKLGKENAGDFYDYVLVHFDEMELKDLRKNVKILEKQPCEKAK